jgi:hypothetical protein
MLNRSCLYALLLNRDLTLTVECSGFAEAGEG